MEFTRSCKAIHMSILYAFSLLILIFCMTKAVFAEEGPTVLVGDTRTEAMKTVVQADYVTGTGDLDWLKTEGMAQAESLSADGSNIVVFASLEDTNKENADDYKEYLNKKVGELWRRGVAVYLVTANPVDEDKQDIYTNERIYAFNQKIKEGLSGNVHYINTYDELAYGFSTYEDGITYGDDTLWQIWDIINKEIRITPSIADANSTIIDATDKIVGWKQMANGNAYILDNGKYAEGWTNINGQKYYFKQDKTAATGLYKIDGKTYGFLKDGKTASGYADIDGLRLFDDTGMMLTGWQKYDDETYYAFPETGLLAIDFTKIQDDTYAFSHNGALLFGWHDNENGRFYSGSDGKLRHGLVELEGVLHLFNEDTFILMVNDCDTADGRHYKITDGVVYQGWWSHDGKKYYFDTDGMATGWKEVEDKLRGFGADGHLLSGFQKMDDGTYLFDFDGTVYKGWYYENDGKQFYLDEKTGVMATGKTSVKGADYYFHDDGHMGKDEFVEIGKRKFYVSPEGRLHYGWQEINGATYYIDAEDGVLTGQNWIDKKCYWFDKDGALRKGWFEEDGNRYHAGDDGALDTGFRNINEEWYFFTSRGKLWMSVNPFLLVIISIVLLMIVYVVLSIIARILKNRKQDADNAPVKENVPTGGHYEEGIVAPEELEKALAEKEAAQDNSASIDEDVPMATEGEPTESAETNVPPETQNT